MLRNPWVVGSALFFIGAASQYVDGPISWVGTVVAVVGLGIIFAALIDNAIYSGP